MKIDQLPFWAVHAKKSRTTIYHFNEIEPPWSEYRANSRIELYEYSTMANATLYDSNAKFAESTVKKMKRMNSLSSNQKRAVIQLMI